MTGKYVLITRPATEAMSTAQEFGKHGFSTLVSPMLEIMPVAFTLENPQSFQAFIFTSANAVRIFADANPARGVPVYTVGEQTQVAAQDAGFTVAGCAHGNSVDLDILLAQAGQTRALHIRGEDVTAPLAGAQSLIVYKAQPVAEFSSGTAEKLRAGSVETVTFYSRRTALNFIKLAQQAGLDESLRRIKALCISNEVLECVQSEQWAHTYAAHEPSRKGMIDLLMRVCP